MRQTAGRRSGIGRCWPVFFLPGLVADPAGADLWQSRAPMPHPAGQAALVCGADGLFYLFGGWSTNPPSIAQTQRTQVYDPSADAWFVGPPVPAYCVGDAALVAPDGKIHLLNNYFRRVYVYDPALNAWEPGWHAAPWVSYASRAIRTSEGRYFIFGGERPQSFTYEYFPATFTAEPRSPVPYCPDTGVNRSIRYPGACAEPDGTVIVLGGLPNEVATYGALPDVVRYHPPSDSWTTGMAPMPTPRFAFAFVRGWNGFLYAIGGSNVYFMQYPPYFDTVELYDPLSDRWIAGPPLPVGLREASAGIDQAGIIYVFGGSAAPDGLYSNHVYALDTRVGAAGPVPGDIDRDGDVDVEDFAALQVCFNGSNLPRNPLPQCARADSDGDGDVDVGDFAAFQVCFNGAARPPACR